MFKTNMDLVRRRRQDILLKNQERESDKDFLKLEESNYVRILPPWSAAGEWRKEAWYHYDVAKGEPLVCPKKNFKQPCPICEYVEELFKKSKTDVEAKELAYKIRARVKFFSNVISYDKQDNKVYILPFGVKLEEKLTFLMDGGASEGVAASGFSGYGDITDVMTGRVVQIIKRSLDPTDRKKVDYDAIVAPQPTPLANAEHFLSQLHNLDDFVLRKQKSYQQLWDLLLGKDESSSVSVMPEAKTAAKPESPPKVTAAFEPPAGSVPGAPAPGFGPVPVTTTASSSGPSDTLARLRALANKKQ